MNSQDQEEILNQEEIESELHRETLKKIVDALNGAEKLVIVDLFAGAGGMSTGAVIALEEIARSLDVHPSEFAELHAVNHDPAAISTHKNAHPWAEHYEMPVQEIEPQDIVPRDRDVHLLIASPDCTSFSAAKGGGPKDPDARIRPWDVLTFVEELKITGGLLFENVKEFRQWGPLDGDNKPIPEKKGEYFDHWIKALEIEDFAVEHEILCCADWGDATTRMRLFIQAVKKGGVSWPEQTHSEDGVGDTEEWRTAAEILDWDDLGKNLWTRDIETDDGRVTPLKNSTMRRIAKGLRLHGNDKLEPFADAIEKIGENKNDDGEWSLPELRERVVPVNKAHLVADALDDPFLVKYSGASLPQPPNAPLNTVTEQTKKYALCPPTVLGQSSNSVAKSAEESPLPTILTSGKISLTTPTTILLRQQNGDRAHPRNVREKPTTTIQKSGALQTATFNTFVLPRRGRCRGLHSNPAKAPEDDPVWTVVAGDSRQGYILTPTIHDYSHGGSSRDVDTPVSTIQTERGGSNYVSTPVIIPFYSERSGQSSRSHSISEPMITVPASNPAALATPEPFIIEYYNSKNAKPHSLDSPLPTQTKKERFALVVPEMPNVGLELRFRMLKPDELARAHSFDDYDYHFPHGKSKSIEQIGNSVPVRTATALARELFVGSKPTLKQFGLTTPDPSESSSMRATDIRKQILGDD